MSHSGSTLLNLMLGASKGTVALGEVSMTWQSLGSGGKYPRVCSCGALVPECQLWGPVARDVEKSDGLSYLPFYQSMLDQIQRLYGDRVCVIESSKALDPLQELRGRYGEILRTIYLVRDIRGYIYAARNRRNRRTRTEPSSENMGLEALRWYRQNRSIKARLDRSGFPYFQIGYEELCCSPAPVFQKLSEFTGVSFDPDTSKPTLENSHVLRGNRMRKNKNKMAGIKYDDHWRSDPWLNRNRWMIWPFLSWNRKNVYGNSVTPVPDWTKNT